jgi:hypothetical protein
VSDSREAQDKPIEDWITRLKHLFATGQFGPSDLIEAVHALRVDETEEGQVWLDELERAAMLDEPIRAATASGIARARLIRLLSVDPETRRLFAGLGHRSGAIQRITLHNERLPSQLRMDREAGLVPGWEERLAAAVAPWAVAPDDGPAVDIEREITAFVAGRHLPWPWLARATVGAFTWYVDSVVTGLLRTIGDPVTSERVSRDRPSTPADLPILREWYWNDDDGPRLPADREFGPIRLHRGDTIGLAQQRVATYVREVAAYLVQVATAAAPIGVVVDKRRQTVVRNVTWFYRHEVQGKSVKSLARAEFAPGEPPSDHRDAIVDSRRKDVRDGINAARALLAEHPFPQPVLMLDEYEAGRL